MEHLLVPESKEVLKKQKDGGQDTTAKLKELPMAKAVTIWVKTLNNDRIGL